MRALRIAAAVVGVAALLAAGVIAWSACSFYASGKIAQNVYVHGIPVGGLTPDQAERVVREQLQRSIPPSIVLKWPGGQATIDKARLGFRLKVREAVFRASVIGRAGGLLRALVQRLALRKTPVDIRVNGWADDEKVRAVLDQLADKVNRPPTDAKVVVEGEAVTIRPGRMGLTLDVDKNTRALTVLLAHPEVGECKLVVDTVEPRLKAHDLQHIDAVLAEYSTRFNPAERNRTHNLKLGATMLDGTVLRSGEEFSLNRALGPRTKERGFKKAPTIINGELVPTYGGGVCQIATTLYNAVLLAGMKVTERHHHSRPIPYTPAGRDATIVYDRLDLKFVNNLSHPVMLQVAADDGRFRVRVLGNHEDKRDVQLVRSGFRSVPKPVKEIPDPALPHGERKVEKKGRPGTRVTLTRIFKREGRVEKKEVLHTDVYAPEPMIVRVGTGQPAPWVPLAPGEAQAPAVGPPAPGAQPAAPHQPSATGR